MRRIIDHNEHDGQNEKTMKTTATLSSAHAVLLHSLLFFVVLVVPVVVKPF